MFNYRLCARLEKNFLCDLSGSDPVGIVLAFNVASRASVICDRGFIAPFNTQVEAVLISARLLPDFPGNRFADFEKTSEQPGDGLLQHLAAVLTGSHAG